MSSLISFLDTFFQTAIQKSYPQLSNQEIRSILVITPSTQPQFGHYQCNSAMKLVKIVKEPPRLIAEKIIKQVTIDSPFIQKIEIAGAGFINIFLNPGFLSEKLDILLKNSHLGINPLEPSKKVIIDFSSPNVAKEMHVGHLRSTIIGDCLAHLFEFLGYEVVRYNHIGDWGTAFGMLITYLKEEEPDFFAGISKPNLPQLMHWYKESKKRFDEDASFKQRSQLEVVQLQSGNRETIQAWEMICDVSRKAYQEIYDLLGVQIIERGESFYNPFLPFIVNELEKKGLVEISDGAKCIFLEGFKNREDEPLPLMIQKSDGGYNYDTTDMAAIYHRICLEKADRLIYVTDAGQSMHFQMIFKAAEKAGYLDSVKVRVDHVPFGLVLGQDGKKFRTRSGETEKLMDLIQIAIKKAEETVSERNPSMSEEERYRLSKTLGIGAIKYADLSNHRLSDYVFSYEKMLRFDGNTAAFLLYSYVRIEGIKRKVGMDPSSLLNTNAIHLEHPSEIDLGLHLLRFQETLELVVEELLPNRLCDYLYGLSEKFNAFFRDCRVEGSPQQNERLLLCEATSRVLKQGLNILGLQTVEQM